MHFFAQPCRISGSRCIFRALPSSQPDLVLLPAVCCLSAVCLPVLSVCLFVLLSCLFCDGLLLLSGTLFTLVLAVSVTGNAGIGMPIILLHDAEGGIVTVELKNGEVCRGLLDEAEDSMNLVLKVCSPRSAQQQQLLHAVVKYLVPDTWYNSSTFICL